jgi:dTDP-4-dehydrorhamnose reductase
MNKVLVLGGSGLLGKAIIKKMNRYEKYEIYSTYYEHLPSINKGSCFKLDLEDLEDISCILNNIEPKIVISCLRGDFEKQLILHTKVAKYLKENNGKLYFFSTTNVFDNDYSKPHYEDDITNSRTDYGRFKIACEKSIIEILKEDACILRIPQVWGKDSPRLRELLNTINNNEAVTVFPKLFLDVNSDEMIAKQLSYIIENKLTGIFHLASEDIHNQSSFYKKLIMKLGFVNTLINENLEEEGYFALKSKRMNEFPEYLRVNSKAVIEYLTSK